MSPGSSGAGPRARKRETTWPHGRTSRRTKRSWRSSSRVDCTVTPGYLATVDDRGAPRVHPVTPVIGGGFLFVFMEPTSPKGRDLRERRSYALHNGVDDTAARAESALFAETPSRLAIPASEVPPRPPAPTTQLTGTSSSCWGSRTSSSPSTATTDRVAGDGHPEVWRRDCSPDRTAEVACPGL